MSLESKVFRRFLVALTLGATFLFPAFGGAQPPVDPELEIAAEYVSRFLESSASAQMDLMLQQTGFSSGETVRDPDEWRRLSAHRKLETAVLMAEAARAGQGEELLHHLSRRIASEANDAIRDERVLSTAFRGPRDQPIPEEPPRRFEFQRTSLEPSVLTAEVRRAIVTVERYIPSFPGGMTALMYFCCGVSPARALELLRQTLSRKDLLAQALLEGGVPPSQRQRIHRLYAGVAEYNDAFRWQLRRDVSREEFREISELTRRGQQTGGCGSCCAALLSPN